VNGVAWLNIARSAGPASQAPLVIGYVGRLVEEKEFELVFWAASKLGWPWTIQILDAGGSDRDRPGKDGAVVGHCSRVTFDEKCPRRICRIILAGVTYWCALFVTPQLEGAIWAGY